MIDDLEHAIRLEREKYTKRRKWLLRFTSNDFNLPDLQNPWVENKFFQEIPMGMPKITKIAAVDGGLIIETMTGFDLIIYRAAGVIFKGIGDKVEAKYLPNVSPKPELYFTESIDNRHEVNRLGSLLRLYAEYQQATNIIEREKPTILFIDGKLSPLPNEIHQNQKQSQILQETEEKVIKQYHEMISVAISNQVLLCGLIKDSRSQEITNNLCKMIPLWIRKKVIKPDNWRGWRINLTNYNDISFAHIVLKEGTRTAWIKGEIPKWLKRDDIEIWSCLIRPENNKTSIRFEILFSPLYAEFELLQNIALKAYNNLCQHGLPIAIPTIIIDVDSRAKLSQLEVDTVVDYISISLGIPRDQLKMKRNYTPDQ